MDYLHTGKQEDLAKTVLQAVQRLRGSYALGVVSMDNTQEIVAARRGNSLVIGIGEGERHDRIRILPLLSIAPSVTLFWMITRLQSFARTA